MARQREELSDLDADTLDALSAIWLYQATDPNDAAVADVDDLLTLRGLVRNPGGQGRRGGFKAHQRMRMWQSLAHSEPLVNDGRTGDTTATTRGRASTGANLSLGRSKVGPLLLQI